MSGSTTRIITPEQRHADPHELHKKDINPLRPRYFIRTSTRNQSNDELWGAQIETEGGAGKAHDGKYQRSLGESGPYIQKLRIERGQTVDDVLRAASHNERRDEHSERSQHHDVRLNEIVPDRSAQPAFGAVGQDRDCCNDAPRCPVELKGSAQSLRGRQQLCLCRNPDENDSDNRRCRPDVAHRVPGYPRTQQLRHGVTIQTPRGAVEPGGKERPEKNIAKEVAQRNE